MINNHLDKKNILYLFICIGYSLLIFYLYNLFIVKIYIVNVKNENFNIILSIIIYYSAIILLGFSRYYLLYEVRYRFYYEVLLTIAIVYLMVIMFYLLNVLHYYKCTNEFLSFPIQIWKISYLILLIPVIWFLLFINKDIVKYSEKKPFWIKKFVINILLLFVVYFLFLYTGSKEGIEKHSILLIWMNVKFNSIYFVLYSFLFYSLLFIHPFILLFISLLNSFYKFKEKKIYFLLQFFLFILLNLFYIYLFYIYLF